MNGDDGTTAGGRPERQPQRPESDPARGPSGAIDPLVIRSLEFIGGMASAGGWRPESDLPEVAFAGRSNVGKSSLLNKLVRRKAFARVSKTPGRTREINFFRVNDRFVLADLPGYGYAQVSKERKQEWRPLIEGYLARSPALRGVVQLLDLRREPSPDDLQMLDFLADIGAPTIIAATKVDKLSRAAAADRLAGLADSLELDPDQIIAFSAVTGVGRDELGAAVATLVEQPSWRHDELQARQAGGSDEPTNGEPTDDEPMDDESITDESNEGDDDDLPRRGTGRAAP